MTKWDAIGLAVFAAWLWATFLDGLSGMLQR